MKYYEVNIKNMVSIDDETASIAESPDEDGIDCLKIGNDTYLPFVGWMKYDHTEKAWVEIDQDEEEKIIATFTEDCLFTEIPASEIERADE